MIKNKEVNKEINKKVVNRIDKATKEIDKAFDVANTFWDKLNEKEQEELYELLILLLSSFEKWAKKQKVTMWDNLQLAKKKG